MRNLNGLTIASRLDMFSNLIQVGAGLSLWCLNEEGELYYSTCNRQEEFLAVMKMSIDIKKVKEIAEENTEDGNHPTFWSDEMGLAWITEAYIENDEIGGIVVMGPIYLSYTSALNTEKKLKKKNLSVIWKRKLLSMLKEVPIISMQVISQYISMMHYILCLKPLEKNSLLCFTMAEYQKLEVENEYTDSEQVVVGEAVFLQAIAEGNLNYMEIFDKELGYAEGFVSETGDVIRDGKNSVMILNALSSRAAIKGGVSPIVVKKMEKDNNKKIENCVTINELIQLNMEILKTYVQMVHDCKSKNGMSAEIIKVCNYIKANLRSSLTLEQISHQFGYTRYYFSRKFIRETGMKVSEYIRNKRLEMAKEELRNTSRSISEISESLQFSNRNYFASSFKAYTGVTPAEYRNRLDKNKPDKKYNN